MSQVMPPPLRGLRLAARSGRTAKALAWAGEGSFARVYRGALGPDLLPCALKIAKAEISGAAERLRAQERVLAAVSHPCLVALLDAGEDTVAPWLALEWLEGGTARDLIDARRRMPLRLALETLHGILAALEALHVRNLAHGDIRSGNVILVPRRGVVLTDPLGDGLARPPADIVATGGLFGELLTGTAVPREGGGIRADVLVLWKRMLQPDPPSAATLLPEVARLQSSL